MIIAAVNPANIGLPYPFRMIDNGEGANAAPDEIGTLPYAGVDCTTEWTDPTRPLTIGNIQVRG